MKVIQILLLLLPMAKKLARATSPRSEGGKKITKTEILRILMGEAEPVAKGIAEIVEVKDDLDGD